MSDRAPVEVQPLVFGAAGTSTVITGSTDTSNVIRMPRDEYTVQVTAFTTGTSIVGGTVVWQGSNDNLAWVALGSATALSTSAAASGIAYGGAGIAVTSKYAYGRGILASTGTGSHQAHVGS